MTVSRHRFLELAARGTIGAAIAGGLSGLGAEPSAASGVHRSGGGRCPDLVAFTHATVIDATGAPPRRDTTVVIGGDRILAVGPDGGLPLPAGALLVDARGKFVSMPPEALTADPRLRYVPLATRASWERSIRARGPRSRSSRPPLRALQAATRDAARHLGLGHRAGTVTQGAAADLVILDADPLAAIGNTRRIDSVVGGVLIDPARRAALLTSVEGRAGAEASDARLSPAAPVCPCHQTWFTPTDLWSHGKH